MWANVAASRSLILTRALELEPVLTPALLEQRESQAAVPEQALTRGERLELVSILVEPPEQDEIRVLALERALTRGERLERVLTQAEPLEPDE
jgi:hypothetical protein